MNHRVEQHVGQPLLVLAQIGVLFAFQVGDLLCNLIGDPLGHGDGGEGFRRGHRFDPAAAPRDIDQADRDVQLALEVPADQIADRGEARKRLRRTEVPLGFHVGLRCPAPHVRHLEEPDVGIRKRLDQLAAAGDALQPVLHIGLPRAEPDVADQHVAAGQGVVALDGQRRSVGGGRERCELHLPPAVLAGGGGNGLPETASPARPVPQTGTARSRCRTMLSVKIDGSSTAASGSIVPAARRESQLYFIRKCSFQGC